MPPAALSLWSLPAPRCIFTCGILELRLKVAIPLRMTFPNKDDWEIAAGLAVALLAAGAAAWLVLRKRPTAGGDGARTTRVAGAIGAHRRRHAAGCLEVDADDGRALTMLLFSYRIGGVDYECSQDVTSVLGGFDVSKVRAGFPCSVRYQPGNPQNSIVMAEGWTGLREAFPVLPVFEDPDPLDT